MSDEELLHYGMPRRSGRYPWGSGDNPFQHGDNIGVYRYYRQFRAAGKTDAEIASSLGMSTTQLRAIKSLGTNELRNENYVRAMKLKEKGLSNIKIGEMLGMNESSVRSLLDQSIKANKDRTTEAADTLKAEVNRVKYLDIGPGANLELGITDTRFKQAVAMLEQEGYKKQYVNIDQMGTNHKTTITVLTKDDVSYQDLKEHQYDIVPVGRDKIITENGDIKLGREPVHSVDSKRVHVRYAEEGGEEKDGVIELRRGVDDISLGRANYAQVRIGVDGTHYLKGMAVYGDDKDFPPGCDIIVNSNKHVGTPLKYNDAPGGETVFKKMAIDSRTGEVDMNNPFSASIKSGEQLKQVQRYYTDKDGKRQVSCLNVVNEEGDWQNWSKNLASQFLSKQSPMLAKKQLQLAYLQKKEEYEEICKLQNPTIKKKLLESFSDGCDAAAVDLKAAALPRQQSHVILPFPDMKPTEIYAPNYKDGEKVVCIRYPHGGTFEIPELTVNNKVASAKRVIGNAPDAVGFNVKVAQQLSGADFDGDSVVVIPLSSSVKIKSGKGITADSPYGKLRSFNPTDEYNLQKRPLEKGMKLMDAHTKAIEMGKTTNLITDMRLKGASDEEIARAVRHSMVVIDAEKHKLNYKASEEDNGILALKKRYQDNGDGKTGASTIISRASSDERVPLRKDRYGINTMNTDPETGKKIYTPASDKDLHYTQKKVTKSGEVYEVEKTRLTKTTKMAEVDDAYTLTSGGSKENPGTPMEGLYANYANQMKALANSARKEYLATPNLKYDPAAKKKYSEEVDSLNRKLLISQKNAPKERQAQLLANAIVADKKEAEPNMDADHLKKVKGAALVTARDRVGAKKQKIEITPKEWEAIQAGAITDSKLKLILDNTDLDTVKGYATPRGTDHKLTSTNKALIKSMDNSGYTLSEIADRMGVSTSTISEVLKDQKGV